MSRRFEVAGIGILVGLLWSLPVLAQAPSNQQDPGVREVTRAFAITNAHVIQAPGRELARATVIIRDGVITAVGPNVAVPFDARVIEGDSLYVYAGFIDALGTIGVEVPAVDTSERVADPDDPPRDRAGILPDRLARHYLNPEASAIERMRGAGFTAANVAPQGGMLSGQSVVILLAGERPEQLVLQGDAALVARFASGAGVYPGTPMAVAATLIELYRQAAQAEEVGTRYAADPTGRARPIYDPVAEALRPSLQGRQPVFFVVDSPQEAHRALWLGREIGLDLVIAGLPESTMLLDRLREAQVPVLAPLGLPDPVKRDTTLIPTDPEHDFAQHVGGEIFLSDQRTRTYLDVDDERRTLHERRLIAAGLYERNALTLQQAGIPFAFATLGEEAGSIRANLRRMVDAGLTRNDALAALTTTPAEMLGIERIVGTVETGKLANLVITDGDYFSEDASIRYVFVDGRRFAIDDAAPVADPDAEVTLIGRWDFTLVTPEMPLSGQLAFTGTPESPTGTLTIPEIGSLTVTDIRLEGNRLTFTVPDAPPGAVEVSGLIVGDRLEAQMRMPGMPSLNFTATRRPD